MSSSKITYVSIEGNIGSGKSTLLNHLKLKFSGNAKYIFLDEPLHLWESIRDESGENMIQKFYKNQEKYSFPFQIMAYTSRLSVVKSVFESIGNILDHYVIIGERCLGTDRHVFAEMLYKHGKMEPVCYQIYLNLFDIFATLHPPNVIIYVDTSPEICYERVNKRSRSGEEIISLDYLQSCHEHHVQFINDAMSNTKQFIIQGNIDIHDDKNPNVLDCWAEEIGKLFE